MSSPDTTASDPTAAFSHDDPDLSQISADTADAESAGEHEPLDLDAIERELAEIETFLEHSHEHSDEHGDEHGDADQPDPADMTESAPDRTDATADGGDADLT